MPFSLRISLITFLQLMVAVMADLVGNTVFFYLDDLLIVSKNVEEHEVRLKSACSSRRKLNIFVTPQIQRR